MMLEAKLVYCDEVISKKKLIISLKTILEKKHFAESMHQNLVPNPFFNFDK